MINIISSSRYKINRNKIKKTVTDFFVKKNLDESHMVNIVFIGKNKMKSIATTYKNEPVALPVLSFPYQEKQTDGKIFLGEVFLCYPQVVLLAAERNKKVEETINSLLIHGLENLMPNL